MNQELKQKILDIIYWGPWLEKVREDGYIERWIENEDMTVEAIIEIIQSFDTSARENE